MVKNTEQLEAAAQELLDVLTKDTLISEMFCAAVDYSVSLNMSNGAIKDRANELKQAAAKLEKALADLTDEED